MWDEQSWEDRTSVPIQRDCVFSINSMAANSKKRSAPTQANGPKPKKLHVEKSKKQSEDDPAKKVKRGRPVTLPQEPVEPDTGSDDEEFEEVPGEPEVGDDMEVDDPPPKDPNGQCLDHIYTPCDH